MSDKGLYYIAYAVALLMAAFGMFGVWLLIDANVYTLSFPNWFKIMLSLTSGGLLCFLLGFVLFEGVLRLFQSVKRRKQKV